MGHLDSLAGLAAAAELDGPRVLAQQGVGGGDVEVVGPGLGEGEGGGRGAGLGLPPDRQQDADVFEMDATVGQRVNVS